MSQPKTSQNQLPPANSPTVEATLQSIAGRPFSQPAIVGHSYSPIVEEINR